jgi:hypothetical protein
MNIRIQTKFESHSKLIQKNIEKEINCDIKSLEITQNQIIFCDFLKNN